jgi:type II secretory pathway pseudopilin PulG
MRRGEPGGYSFVAVLVLLAIVSFGLAFIGPLWSQQAQREREQELLRIGTLYARALANYRDSSPGSAKQYPASLDALLVDTRFVGVVRHLREPYPDPVNAGQAWGLLRNEAGCIVGVHSLSTAAPLAQGAVAPDGTAMPAATQYSQWKFIARSTSP